MRRGGRDGNEEHGEEEAPDQGRCMVRGICEGSDIDTLALRVALLDGGYTARAARMWRNW